MELLSFVLPFLGDLGFADDDGHIIITDRIKELIKYKGLQVTASAHIN